MRGALDKLTVKGFKSIQDLDEFKLGDLSVIIGANGAGKGNFVQILLPGGRLGKVTERGNIMSSTPLSKWGIDVS